MHIYIIAPSPVFSSNEETAWIADRVVGGALPLVRVASAAITTVAALAPQDFEVTLCHEELDPVDFDSDADVIAITANVSQAQRGITIAKRFKSLGKTVLMGGAHVSLAPDLFEGVADSLVLGELEPIADDFFKDLRAGTLKKRYKGDKADLTKSPMPRWDLYPNDRAISGVVQTSRGCPFECNFCDVIQYLGRVQRHKSDDQVLGEIQNLYDLGYRNINLSDDNFTVYRSRTKSLLGRIKAWNGADGRDHVTFNTQVSIDVAKDAEILTLCNEAGLRQVFLGIESDNPDSLAESKKRQNLRINIQEQCRKIVGAGLMVQGGLIVGFDSDTLNCFERQFKFAMSLPAIMFKVSVLVAPVATPLYHEMERTGRIVTDEVSTQFAGGNLMTNFEPAQMTREQLALGAGWLFAKLMRPESARHRFDNLAAVLAPAHWSSDGRKRPGKPRPAIASSYRALLAKWSRDKEIRSLMEHVSRLGEKRPEIREDLLDVFAHYLSVYNNLVEAGFSHLGDAEKPDFQGSLEAIPA